MIVAPLRKEKGKNESRGTRTFLTEGNEVHEDGKNRE
jgi:hypothetical protein